MPGLQRTIKASVSDSSTSKTVTARCPAGKQVLGGGGTVTGGRGQVVLERLQPVQATTGDRFVVGAREDGTGYSGSWRLTAYALCANPLADMGSPLDIGQRKLEFPAGHLILLYRPTFGRIWGQRQRRRRAGSPEQPNKRFQRHRGVHPNRRAGGYQRL